MRLYVGSYKEYNNGSLKGGWIDLPKEKSEIRRFMKDVVGIGPDNEESMIQDWECEIDGLVHETSNIYDLNVLATLWDQLSPFQQEQAKAYIECQGSSNHSFVEVGNILAKADDIPYYSYDFVGQQYFSSATKEELYGRTRADLNALTSRLEELEVEDYFDYERYGLDESRNGDVELFDDGYVDLSQDFDLDFYTWNELKEIAGLGEEEEE